MSKPEPVTKETTELTTDQTLDDGKEAKSILNLLFGESAAEDANNNSYQTATTKQKYLTAGLIKSNQYEHPDFMFPDYPLESVLPYVYKDLGPVLAKKGLPNPKNWETYLPWKIVLKYYHTYNTEPLYAMTVFKKYNKGKHQSGLYREAHSKFYIPEPGGTIEDQQRFGKIIARDGSQLSTKEYLSNYYFTDDEFGLLYPLYLGENYQGLDLSLNAIEVLNQVEITLDGANTKIRNKNRSKRRNGVLYIPRTGLDKMAAYYRLEQDVAQLDYEVGSVDAQLKKRRQKSRKVDELQSALATYTMEYMRLHRKQREYEISNTLFFLGQTFPHVDNKDFEGMKALVVLDDYLTQALVTYIDSSKIFKKFKNKGADFMEKKVVAHIEKRLLAKTVTRGMLRGLGHASKGLPFIWKVAVDLSLNLIVDHLLPKLMDEEGLKRQIEDANIQGYRNASDSLLREYWEGGLDEAESPVQIEVNYVLQGIPEMSAGEAKTYASYYLEKANAMRFAADAINPRTDYRLAKGLIDDWVKKKGSTVDQTVVERVKTTQSQLKQISDLSTRKEELMAVAKFHLRQGSKKNEALLTTTERADERIQESLDGLHHADDFDKDYAATKSLVDMYNNYLKQQGFLRQNTDQEDSRNPLRFVDELGWALKDLKAEGVSFNNVVRVLYPDLPNLPFLKDPHYGYLHSEKAIQIMERRDKIQPWRLQMGGDDLHLLWDNEQIKPSMKWNVHVQGKDWEEYQTTLTNYMKSKKFEIDFGKLEGLKIKDGVTFKIQLEVMHVNSTGMSDYKIKIPRYGDEPFRIETIELQKVRFKIINVHTYSNTQPEQEEEKQELPADDEKSNGAVSLLYKSHLPFNWLTAVNDESRKREDEQLTQRYFGGKAGRFKKRQAQKKPDFERKEGKRMVALPPVSNVDFKSNLNSGYYFTVGEIHQLLPMFAQQVDNKFGPRLDLNLERIFAYNNVEFRAKSQVIQLAEDLPLDHKLWIPKYIPYIASDQLKKEGLADKDRLGKRLVELNEASDKLTGKRMKRELLLQVVREYLLKHEEYMFKKMIVLQRNLTEFFYMTRKAPISQAGFEVAQQSIYQAIREELFQSMESVTGIANTLSKQGMATAVDQTEFYKFIKNGIGDFIDLLGERTKTATYVRKRKWYMGGDKTIRIKYKTRVLPMPFDNLGLAYKVFIDKKLSDYTQSIADFAFKMKSNDAESYEKQQKYVNRLGRFIDRETEGTRKNMEVSREIIMTDVQSLVQDLSYSEINGYIDKFSKMNRLLDRRFHEIDFNNLGYANWLLNTWLVENAVSPTTYGGKAGEYHKNDQGHLEKVIKSLRNQDIRNHIYSRLLFGNLTENQRRVYQQLLPLFTDDTIESLITGSSMRRAIFFGAIENIDEDLDLHEVEVMRKGQLDGKVAFGNRPFFWLDQVMVLTKKMGFKDVSVSELMRPYQSLLDQQFRQKHDPYRKLEYEGPNIDEIVVSGGTPKLFAPPFIRRELEAAQVETLESQGLKIEDVVGARAEGDGYQIQVFRSNFDVQAKGQNEQDTDLQIEMVNVDRLVDFLMQKIAKNEDINFSNHNHPLVKSEGYKDEKTLKKYLTDQNIEFQLLMWPKNIEIFDVQVGDEKEQEKPTQRNVVSMVGEMKIVIVLKRASDAKGEELSIIWDEVVTPGLSKK